MGKIQNYASHLDQKIQSGRHTQMDVRRCILSRSRVRVIPPRVRRRWPTWSDNSDKRMVPRGLAIRIRSVSDAKSGTTVWKPLTRNPPVRRSLGTRWPSHNERGRHPVARRNVRWARPCVVGHLVHGFRRWASLRGQRSIRGAAGRDLPAPVSPSHSPG